MVEEWRPVVGYKGFYEVSSYGRVRSVPRQVTQKGGTWNYPSCDLKADISAAGYPRVVLSKDNKRRTLQIHRLVAEAFIPNPEGLPLVRHWDDVKTDNRLVNLLWGTNSDNQLDSIRNGSHPQSRKTHCPAGHLYEESSVRSDSRGRTFRICRKCHALRERERRRIARLEPKKGSSNVQGNRLLNAKTQAKVCELAEMDMATRTS